MSTAGRVVFGLALLVGLYGIALYLSQRGTYGWTLFVLLPICAGALGTWAVRPANGNEALLVGLVIGFAGSMSFLLAGREGWVCTLMALPIMLLLAILGSMGAFLLRPFGAKKPTAFALLFPATLFFDTHAKPPVYSVTTSQIIDAPPGRVWKYVVAFPEITSQQDWMLRLGFASPVRTRIEGTGPGARRYCDLSTGTVAERVLIWDEPRLLRFAVTATPPAMTEMGLYGPVHPKHLDGYYASKQGQFELRPLPGHRTLVVGTSEYQHGLWPAEYWRWWSDAVVHHIHRRVLKHLQQLAEREQ